MTHKISRPPLGLHVMCLISIITKLDNRTFSVIYCYYSIQRVIKHQYRKQFLPYRSKPKTELNTEPKIKGSISSERC